MNVEVLLIWLVIVVSVTLGLASAILAYVALRELRKVKRGQFLSETYKFVDSSTRLPEETDQCASQSTFTSHPSR